MLLCRSSMCGDWHEDSSLAISVVRRVCADADGYYALLGLEPSASDGDIRRAGKTAIMEHHPDHGGDEEEFIKVVEAYRTLSNPRTRAEYDMRPPYAGEPVIRRYAAFEPQFKGVGEPAWYKEPTMVLSDADVARVRMWHSLVLQAARDFRQSLKIKVGVCRCPAGYYVHDDIALIGIGTEPERWAACIYVLKRMVEK